MCLAYRKGVWNLLASGNVDVGEDSLHNGDKKAEDPTESLINLHMLQQALVAFLVIPCIFNWQDALLRGAPIK